jgi:hypothetical protein
MRGPEASKRQTPEQMIQRGLKSSHIGIGFNFVLASFKCTVGLRDLAAFQKQSLNRNGLV